MWPWPAQISLQVKAVESVLACLLAACDVFPVCNCTINERTKGSCLRTVKPASLQPWLFNFVGLCQTLKVKNVSFLVLAWTANRMFQRKKMRSPYDTSQSDAALPVFFIWNTLLAGAQYGLSASVSIPFLDSRLPTKQAQKQFEAIIMNGQLFAHFLCSITFAWLDISSSLPPPWILLKTAK